jgi:RND superfamily putative drug exporter
VVTGGVITSAGVVLAATFAALAVIPILFLVQLAIIVAFGVLLDALVVRALFVPALVHDVCDRVWWPSKLAGRGRQARSVGGTPRDGGLGDSERAEDEAKAVAGHSAGVAERDFDG